VRIRHGHVHVQPEDQLAPRHVLHLVDEVAVAVARGDALALEETERMRAGRADAKPLLLRDARHVAAELPQGLADVGRCSADGGRDLEHRLHQLRVHVRLELVAGHRLEHGVDVLDEVERLRVEEHVLLLDAERVRLALTELVVQDAAAGREALARDRRGVDLLHGSSMASASISTNERGSRRRVTTQVDAGLIEAKTSPCARATSSQCSGAVTYIRVRTTCSGLAPASASAETMISRHRRAWAYAPWGGGAPSGMTGA